MNDFARDDHDHEVCVASLSVQIYTVPSLVREQLLSLSPFLPFVAKNRLIVEPAISCYFKTSFKLFLGGQISF